MFQTCFIYWRFSMSVNCPIIPALLQSELPSICGTNSVFQIWIWSSVSAGLTVVSACSLVCRWQQKLGLLKRERLICFARLAVVTHHVSLLSWFWILLVCDWTLHNKIFSSLAEQEVSCRLKWLEPTLGNVLVAPAVHLVFVMEAVVFSPSFLALSPWKMLTLRQVSLTAYIVYTRTRITRLASQLSWYWVNGG